MAIKNMLADWGYNKSSIKVNTSASGAYVTIGGKELLTVRVEDYTLHLKWEDGEWDNS